MLAHEDFFRLEKSIMKWTGFGLEKKSTFCKIYSFIVAVLLLPLYAVMQYINLFSKGFNEAIDSCLVVLGSVIVLSIIFATYFQRKKLLELFASLTKNSEHDLTQDWLKFKYATTVIYLAFFAVCVISQIIYTLGLRLTQENPTDWKLVFGDVSLINVTYSPNFELVFCYQSMTILYASVGNAVNTVVITGLLNYIATQFKILQIKLRNAVVEGNVRYFVEDHIKTLLIFKEVQRMYGPAVLIVFLGNVSVTCIEIYRASLSPVQSFATIRLVMEVFTMSFQILLISAAGKNMTEEGEKIANAAYDSDFVGTSLSLQKSLIIIMRQAQRPVVFKAGKLVDASMITFASILRMSYSAYAMLKNVNNT